MIWTDADGRQWEVIDWKLKDATGKKKRVPVGEWDSDGRAFVPHDGTGPTLLFDFGRVAYRDTSDRTLRDQLAHAKPATTAPARRFWGR